MYRIEGLAAIGLACLLSACCLWTPHHPAPIDVLAPENAFPQLPAGAKVVDVDTFLWHAGRKDVELLSPSAARRKAEDQYESDVALLSAIPENERSPHVRAILQAVHDGVDPFAEGTTRVVVGGGEQEFRLLSLAVDARIAADAERLAVDVENSLAAYLGAYQAAPSSARHGLPAPQALTGKPLDEVEKARDALEAALALVPALDAVSLDDVPEPEAPSVDAAAMDDKPAPPSAGCLLGPGTDGSALCNTLSIHRNFWWPLKWFVSPIKDQARRGLCWTFAAVGGLETRERVVNDRIVDLSEQYFCYRWKTTYGMILEDGDVVEAALGNLNTHPGSMSFIPPEGYWIYNPSCSRPQNPSPVAPFFDSCRNYTGDCSESASQGPLTCVKSPSGWVCTIDKFVYDGPAGIPSANTVQLWKSGQGLDLASLRAYMSDGRPLLASFKVYRGFQQPVDGFVVDEAKFTAKGEKNGDGHVVLFVGFIPNEDLLVRMPSAPPAAGGGYFIAKNSWNCSGDGGYWYVPVKYVQLFFSRLSVLAIPETRSKAWNDAKGIGEERPRLQITKPFVSTDVQIEPHRVDFGKDIPLEGTATDSHDGPGCCLPFQWKVLTRKKPDGAWGPGISSGPGATANIPASVMQGGIKELRVELTGKDSDGHQGKAVLWLADIEPKIEVVWPVPNQSLGTGQVHIFSAKVVADGAGPLDCSVLTWRTSFPGDPVKQGCSADFTFTAAGARDLKVEWISGLRALTATVPIDVVSLGSTGPPVISLAIQSDNMFDSSPVARYTFADPGGPGPAHLGSYKLVWELEYQGVKKTIAPMGFLGAPDQVLVDSRATFDVSNCLDETPDLILHLTITDPEGLSATKSAPFTYRQQACIN